jgi:hydantoinase/oxoprolinase-like protein
MSEPGYRLGVAIDRGHVAGALADADGDIVAVTTRLIADSAPGTALTEVLLALTAHGRRVEEIDRVAFAISEVDGLAAFPKASMDEQQTWCMDLGPVAVVRIGAATTSVPPVALWPADLRDRVVLASMCVAGGARLDGSPLEPFDEAALVAFARSIAGRVEAVAVTSVFATLTPEHELTAAAVLEKELGTSVPVVLSHEIGGTGLLDRENATVLQAALTKPAGRDAARVQTVLVEHGLGHAEVFFARNDGTIAALDYAATHPLTLFDGAVAATVRGAARLAGEQEALVALTRADGEPPVVCAVTGGQPRLTTGHTTVVGVPTSLRVVARVLARPCEQDGSMTDARAMAEAVDRAKTSPADLPLLLGGPGADELAATLPLRLTGTLGVRCPPWAAAAAAVGVATAPVGGEAERVMPLRGGDDAVTREALSEAARAAAVRAGADPRRAKVTLFEEITLTYHSEPAVALRARAEGPPRPGVSPASVPAGTGVRERKDVS